MGLRERIGIDLGRRIRLEEGIEWAAQHAVRFIDIQLDTAANAVTEFDDQRAERVRQLAATHGI
ncbi:MAG: sugar phosphate isomerase/epimerase, partial [Betaproteobacteria bacterium]